MSAFCKCEKACVLLLSAVWAPAMLRSTASLAIRNNPGNRRAGAAAAPNANGQTGSAETPAADGDRKGELLFVPVPVSSQAIGTGLAPVAAYVFFPSKGDKVSQPSVLAVAGLYTTTKTYGLGIGGNFNLAEDRYQLIFLTGAARARYEFFGIGNNAGTTGKSLWLNQKGRAVFLQGLRRIGWNIFVGPRFSYRNIRAGHQAGSSEDLSQDFPQLPASWIN
jgi:hypothetical protein